MKEFISRDLWQTAFLMTHGAKLKEMVADKSNKRRVVFVLEGQEKDLTELGSEYYQGAAVPAFHYKDVVLELKNRLYRFKDQERGDNENESVNSMGSRK